MKLIMYLALAEFGFQMLLILQFYICDFGFHFLFAATVYFNVDVYYLARSAYILVAAADFASTFCVNLALSLNVCLCMDLILMIRDPFKSKEARVPMYLFVSFTFSLGCAVTMCFYSTNDVAFKISSFLVFCLLCLYIFMLLASIFYPYRKLSGPSFSK